MEKLTKSEVMRMLERSFIYFYDVTREKPTKKLVELRMQCLEELEYIAYVRGLDREYEVSKVLRRLHAAVDSYKKLYELYG